MRGAIPRSGSVISRAIQRLGGSLAPMRRRLREKLHMSEFADLGFDGVAELDLGLDQQVRYHVGPLADAWH